MQSTTWAMDLESLERSTPWQCFGPFWAGVSSQFGPKFWRQIIKKLQNPIFFATRNSSPNPRGSPLVPQKDGNRKHCTVIQKAEHLIAHLETKENQDWSVSGWCELKLVWWCMIIIVCYSLKTRFQQIWRGIVVEKTTKRRSMVFSLSQSKNYQNRLRNHGEILENVSLSFWPIPKRQKLQNPSDRNPRISRPFGTNFGPMPFLEFLRY